MEKLVKLLSKYNRNNLLIVLHFVTQGTDNLILMGDQNVVVGEEKEGNIVGKYGQQNSVRNINWSLQTLSLQITKDEDIRGQCLAIQGNIRQARFQLQKDLGTKLKTARAI